MRHHRLSPLLFFLELPFTVATLILPLLNVAFVFVLAPFLELLLSERIEGTFERVDLAERAIERREDVSASEERGMTGLLVPLVDSPEALLVPFVVGSEEVDCVLGDRRSGFSEHRVLVSSSVWRWGVEIGVGVLLYAPDVWKVFGVLKGCAMLCRLKLS